MSIPPYKKRGLPMTERIRLSVEIDAESECWVWQLSTDVGGYGRIGIHSRGRKMRLRLAHRVSYEVFVGPIPEGLELDHLCRVRACVNPEHLEPVTSAENTRRSIRSTSSKSHCVHGHEYDSRNTRITRKTGQRQCRVCDRLRKQAKKLARAAA